MDFVVYSKSGCPYCSKVEQVLKLAEQKHVVYKLDVDYDRAEFYEKFGVGSTFPQVLVNGKILGGCSDTVQFLKEHKLV
jgi:glutaredoxin